ncbi:uncharacterized protein LOC135156038 [Lytechinus pictus]|uniref:uncharacterized protein LOC135156038 n=1 Tax=Lytechinus pictus TaxID=7653 RepID=UPI0030BA1B7B
MKDLAILVLLLKQYEGSVCRELLSSLKERLQGMSSPNPTFPGSLIPSSQHHPTPPSLHPSFPLFPASPNPAHPASLIPFFQHHQARPPCIPHPLLPASPSPALPTSLIPSSQHHLASPSLHPSSSPSITQPRPPYIPHALFPASPSPALIASLIPSSQHNPTPPSLHPSSPPSITQTRPPCIVVYSHAAGGDGETMEKVEARETKDGGRDILDTIPQELDIEVLSSGNKVAVSVGGTPAMVSLVLTALRWNMTAIALTFTTTLMDFPSGNAIDVGRPNSDLV